MAIHPCVLCSNSYKAGKSHCTNCGKKFFKQLQSGIVIPKEKSNNDMKIEERKKTSVKHFSVIYYSDLIKFLELIEKEHARLNCVNHINGNGMGFFSEYVITYSHHEELSMEVLC